MKKKNMNVKNLKLIKLFAFLLAFFLISNVSVNYVAAQCKPMIKIDGKATVVNENDDFGLKLPIWLKAGQTLAVGSSVSAISILEFTENLTSNTLEYSKVVIVDGTTTLQDGTVPASKVWKIESIVKVNNSSTYKSATFGPGTYTWKVPACAEEICIDMWGAGGGGGGGGYVSGSGQYYIGGGGGGGGYGSECFSATGGSSYTIVVGAGGKGGVSGNPGVSGTAGGNSSIDGGAGIIIQVSGGSGGISNGGAGGNGGSSTALSNADGAKGVSGCHHSSIPCGGGGAGANGGSGGAPVLANGNGNHGIAPGGGGSGAWGSGTTQVAGNGADGKVIISW